MADDSNINLKFYQKNWFMWLMLIFISPIGIFLMWKNKKFNVIIRVILSIFFVFWFVIFIEGFRDAGLEKNKAHVHTNKNIKKVDLGTETANFYKKLLGSLKGLNPKMKEKSFRFIQTNYNLFPVKNENDIKNVDTLVDKNIQYKHLEKNINNYLDKLVNIKGKIVRVDETDIDDKEILIVHIINNKRESFQIVYLGNMDIFKYDEVTCTGVPVALNSFKNLRGGATNTVVVIASKMTKINK